MPHEVSPWPDEQPVKRPGDFTRTKNGTPYVAHPTRTSKIDGKKADLIALCAERGITVPEKPIVAQLHKLLGGRPTMVPYGRPSSLGKQIENMSNLMKWSERATALGLYLDAEDGDALLNGLAEDIMAAQAVADLDDPVTRSLLDSVVVKAKDRAQAGIAALRGTHIHERTEDFDSERDWMAAAMAGEDLGLPAHVVKALVQAWERMLMIFGFEILAVEAACVDDLWRQAGTLDRIVRLTRDIRFVTSTGEYVTIPAGTVLILDIKTGRLRLGVEGFVSYWHGYSVQLASYAHSVPYDTDKDVRGVWEWERAATPEEVDAGCELGVAYDTIDQRWAIIAHLDVLTALNDGVAKCRLVLVDLEAGRYAGSMCVAAREWERRTDVFSIPTDDLTVSVPVVGVAPDNREVPASLIRSDVPTTPTPSPLAEPGDGDVPAGFTPPGSVLPADPFAAVPPTVEPPVTPPTVEAAPDATVEGASGAESFAERRKRALERHRVLSPALKRQFRERKLHPADMDHIEALLDELEHPPSVQALAAARMASDAARRTA